jgi:hypothetical protein
MSLVALNELDALCFPSTQVSPPTRAELNAGKWTVLGFPTNTLIAAQTWMPSICLPAGFTPDGLPVGMEIVVPPYHEPDLFRLGYAFERATGYAAPQPARRRCNRIVAIRPQLRGWIDRSASHLAPVWFLAAHGNRDGVAKCVSVRATQEEFEPLPMKTSWGIGFRLFMNAEGAARS